MGQIETSIRSKLTAALEPSELTISNDSHLHSHHAAMNIPGENRKTGETHFSVYIVSGAFSGKKAIARHRLVNGALKEEFDAGLHALAIKAKSPEEVTTPQ